MDIDAFMGRDLMLEMILVQRDSEMDPFAAMKNAAQLVADVPDVLVCVVHLDHRPWIVGIAILTIVTCRTLKDGASPAAMLSGLASPCSPIRMTFIFPPYATMFSPPST